MVLVGEVGLSGELRSVGQVDARLNEATKLGFKRCVLPRTLRRVLEGQSSLDVLAARSLSEAVDAAMVG